MSHRYLRLAEAPKLVVQHPLCSACEADLTSDGEVGWCCDSCGTTWPFGANDGDPGTLAPDVTGPIVPASEAWWCVGHNPTERDTRATRLGLKDTP